MRARILFFLAALCVGAVQAAGPVRVATLDRASWPAALDSPAAFDSASRAEILMFARALLDSEAADEATLKQRLGIKQVDLNSLEQVRQRLWGRLLENYRFASQACDASAAFCLPVDNLGALRQQAASLVIAPAFSAWAGASEPFHRTYLNEQLRLAALFPRISSEIARFSDQERTGDELADRQFLLTFDDGPTLTPGGTERMIEVLRAERLTGIFYVLGRNLQARAQKGDGAALRDLYAGQCVGLHGWEHKSHAQWGEWQESIQKSAALVRQTLPDSQVAWFRPPYGQRQADSAAFFQAQGLRVGLWNIDSQDWHSKLSADAATQRVLTLMLLWRRGVILFHDIHSKAQTAVPGLLQATRGAGVNWLECGAYR